MTDKKLTDEEIIKCLERCVKCGNRNYDTYIVLDLINRQKEEIERLQKEVNLVSMQFQDIQERQEESQAEIDKLNAENMLTMSERNAFRTSFYDVLKQLKTAKAKAVKEFAERLKKKIINTPFGIDCTGETDEYREGCLRGLVAKQHNVIDMVDNLVKEMVGE